MDIQKLTPEFSVSPQISVDDVSVAASMGFTTIICNRPDNESDDQVNSDAIQQAAESNGLNFIHLPVISGKITDADVQQFKAAIDKLDGPVLAYCRSGTRSRNLWTLAESSIETPAASHNIVIIGGGAGGQAVAASILKRQPDQDIAIIEPQQAHYYQPGWTLVGGGVFSQAQTKRTMTSVMPKQVTWYQTAANKFEPERQQITLENGERLSYKALIVATGLKLDWEAIPGLNETLGKNGVTSNYRFDLAPYTWELVQSLKSGNAIFTQPPMPIKCAGAPQKAMYLSCDEWHRNGLLDNISVSFCTAGAALFGVQAYVPALQKYIDKYGIKLQLQNKLTAVDGPNQRATFAVTDAEGNTTTEVKPFDMLHVCPPQKAPEVIATSPIADEAGWVDVSPESLQHTQYHNIFALGDIANAPNAKTAAAVRKQAPVVAENVLSMLSGKPAIAVYDGYGSCPLTVERGKIVLAEFGYGGKLLPTFPTWLVNGTKPSRLSWLLKEKMLPWLYWDVMLKGKEWLAAPSHSVTKSKPASVEDACNFEEKQK
ncbi:bifunctional protein tyrosine phosphatase family protein/NAD(P)/FAD-dependent oxidoreductase [Idiomarina seosinensis]|uniref:TIGR01244 family phosphatase n=1 Tax=Idiomarina seosinensis TaxID=281739 RepID=A0A432ZBB0_9GAMM|nr:bifunctional protein tyrosine phosphatase family protein/NAD(P)/FAD-dependent oxidoreductase [Idiomarina seosinensis]RUO75247.1 TIGR01244 family phosphatase [Idiomarina seosinensis]